MTLAPKRCGLIHHNLHDDATAFHEKGNKAAGTRLRKAYQEIKVLSQAGRTEVTELKNKESK